MVSMVYTKIFQRCNNVISEDPCTVVIYTYVPVAYSAYFLSFGREYSVQVLYSTPDQSESGSACRMTRSANHRRHSVVI